MPLLEIQGNQIPYDEKDIITFPEGLIGLPQLTRMVAVRQTTIEPFIWLASVDLPNIAFVVVEAQSLFPTYAPPIPEDVKVKGLFADDEKPVVLAIVLIESEWEKSSANLRAPVFISAKTMCGVQVALTDNHLDVREPLPMIAVAA